MNTPRPMGQMTAQQTNRPNLTVTANPQPYSGTVSKNQHSLQDNSTAQAKSNTYKDKRSNLLDSFSTSTCNKHRKFQMKNTQIQKKSRFTAENVATAAFVAAAFLAPTVGMAADDFTSASGGACKFIKNIHTVLNLMSVAVVTIAIIFAGYQIAFAHKRISDVAPILIGGVLIGAAGQIAKMLVGNADSCSAGTTSAMLQVLQIFA